MASAVSAETAEVKNPAELQAALRSLKAGDTLRIGPGEYPGGNFLAGLSNLTVEASDPAAPPLFRGGKQAWHFSRCPGLTLRRIHCSGQSGNGINLDDGGKRDEPVKTVLLEGLSVSDIGPQGNFDAIKCSGLQDLRIKDCEISGWGGQAIDFVGCSDAVISGCRITGKEGYSLHTGPQFKGGSRNIVIEKCVFKNAGGRPIQAGGSTGIDYFRPPGVKYEAKDIIIRDNIIEGGACACAFTGVDGAEFTGNTVVNPGKWIFRILQETREEGFAPCRNVKISGNKFRFRRAQVGTEINISDGTAPETFQFENNRWLAEDRPEASKPKLPVEEKGGVYGAVP
ncbi:right-handed parallel beta-helix repeat-containing protein [Luteolibacter sp. Populi]|uniref:right-handed parallel beta-helix repeat-containing protein n=1 Tax=Luteolibacter sp. Populi TaxID=3230487 RepID=UPI003467A37C